jgi:hypothetical protein
LKVNRLAGISYKQPTTLQERRSGATLLMQRFRYRIPIAIDAMDNRAEDLFAAWPERLYIISPGGRILYKGKMGPFGFDPKEAEKVLEASLPRSHEGTKAVLFY